MINFKEDSFNYNEFIDKFYDIFVEDYANINKISYFKILARILDFLNSYEKSQLISLELSIVNSIKDRSFFNFKKLLNK